jgi:hypothetical protein
MQQYLQCNLESNKVKEKNVTTYVAQHWKKQKSMREWDEEKNKRERREEMMRVNWKEMRKEEKKSKRKRKEDKRLEKGKMVVAP